MTGLPDWNFEAFHAGAARLRAMGHLVINPAELNPDPATPWLQCMRIDIGALIHCEAIALLPGWQQSKGAALEHAIAQGLGFHVLELA